MTTKFTLRVHNDVQEAVNALLSREPEGTSVNYVICKAVLGYAKSIQSGVQVPPKVATPVVVSPEERVRKWTKKSEPVYEEEVLDENGYVIS